MIKRFYAPLLLVVVVMLTASCSTKMGALSPELFTTTPQVLEAVGGQVPVTINGNFPAKYFPKKAIVEVTPRLAWNGGEAKGQPATFQGEKVEDNYQSIAYATGGRFTMKTSYEYVPAMAKSELYLDFKARVGNKEIAIPSVKIADGVIATSELVNQTLATANPELGADAFQRIIKEAQQANIMFLIQQANIRAGELKNLKDFNAQVKEVAEAPNKKISNIEISAYASPDGGVGLNTKLAENRESNTDKALTNELKRAKMTEVMVDSKYTAQDWEGFKELVSKSNIQDKDVILRVLSMYQDPERREAEIKNLSSVYKTLAEEILPQLRRSRLTLNYEIIGKSDEEISRLAASNPSELNVEELLYAATLTNDDARKASIYTQATRQFPNDFRAFNNLGLLAYQQGDKAGAENRFEQAARIAPNAPEVNMNLGLIALAKGNENQAKTYLGKASGTENLNETMGNLYILEGQYDRAVNSFGDAKTNSAALAQILAKDYNKARTTLDNVTAKDAYTDYLKAILGARTNNAQAVISNLRAAVQKDASLAKTAADDIEFAKFATNSDFQNIVR
ncbi:MAG: tetratricopeptide repeat protein [Prevotellaceae bacterium]|jgi:Tfp pilus assembly protein PilF|nr:tetratricopeptide repeat protein [Prevotellaceae bacterium]